MSSIGAVFSRIGQIERRLEQLGLKNPAIKLGKTFSNLLESQMLGDEQGAHGNLLGKNNDAGEKQSSLNRSDIMGLIQSAATQTGVDPNLVKAVTQVESNFNPYAVSKAGAQGLMQLMPETAAELGVDDLLNPAENLKAGSQYLKSMLEKYHDVPKAIAAYNAGPGAVDKYNGIPPYAETTQYVKKVLAAYHANQKIGG